MARRREVVRSACDRRGVRSADGTTFQAREPRFSQQLVRHRSHFLLDASHSGAVYCYAFKAASMTWMAVFARLHPDPNIREKIKLYM